MFKMNQENLSLDKQVDVEAIQELLEERKKSIEFVFEQNAELASIGSVEQYDKYLNTIFPESTFKKIVFHNSDADFIEEGFRPVKANFDTLNSIEGIYNFSTNKEFVKRFAQI